MNPPTFGALGVPQDLVARLASDGIESPSPIQAAVIADAIAGRDVTGRAPTGSGKTLAFGLPMVANLTKARRIRPTAMVLVPTRELAQQIADVVRPLAQARGRKVVALYGGVGYDAQRKALNAGVDAIIACPGRLEDLMSMGAVHLDEVDQVIIDEADRMADMGFLPAVKRLVGKTAQPRQVMMFSATFDGAVGKLSEAIQQRPVRHEVGPAGPDMTAAKHVFWRVDRTERPTHTAEVVTRLGSTMVFTRTRHGADRLTKQLNRVGVTAPPSTAGQGSPSARKALKAFADGSTSPRSSPPTSQKRGVHVDAVAGVVHFDVPADSHPTYDAPFWANRSRRCHRCGRHSGGARARSDVAADPAGDRGDRKIGSPSLADLDHTTRSSDRETAARASARASCDPASETDVSEAGHRRQAQAAKQTAPKPGGPTSKPGGSKPSGYDPPQP
ncbi:MAG: DEAD/DEAH box helicase [Ilumatobacteraceae bacterium]